ncbi:hypothetical protein ACJJTC_006509 [Scirpophaga incertulas]
MLLLSDGSDLEGVENVLNIKYIKLLRICMRMLTAWPYKYVGEKESRRMIFFRLYTLSLEVCCWTPGILYIYNYANKLSFFEMGNTYITLLMNTIAILRLEMIFRKTYYTTVGMFIKELHLFNHRNRSEFAMKMHLLVHKMSHFYTMYLFFMMILGIVMFNALPLCNNIMSGAFSGNAGVNVTFEHAVYYSLPFDYKTNFNGYLAVATFNVYISCICSSIFCIFDLLISLMVFHIWGHLRILVHDFETFPGPQNKEYYTKEEKEKARVRLRDIIKNHQMVLGALSNLIDTFGAHLAMYYGFHQSSCCLLMLECSPMDAKSLLRYGLLTMLVFQQMIQISVVFEMVGAMPEYIINAVYSMPWEYMDKSERQVVEVVLRQVQRPMSLKALSIVDVGCKTMVTIMKTSCTYFIMLRTMATDE